MDNKSSIGSLVVGALSVVALVLSLYAVTHLGGAHPTAQFGATAFQQGEVQYNPFIFYSGASFGSSQQTIIDGNGLLTVGASGTGLSNVVVKTCSMKADNSIAASSTGYAYCTGVTGVTSADFVQAIFGTSTANYAFADSWEIVDAKASSTPGAIDFELFNNSGKTNTPSAVSRTASSTNLIVAH